MKQIKFGKESREKLLDGVEILDKAVGSTLGAKGRNVIYASGQDHIITKDGVTVADQIMSDDTIEQAAINTVRQAARRTATEAGDGTTSATVIASEIIRRAMNAIGNGANPMDVKRGIDVAVDKALEYINNTKEELKDVNQIQSIATVSANNDPEMGSLVAGVFDKVGKDGAVRLEETQQYKTRVDTIEGCQFIGGYLSPAFITDRIKNVADYKDTMILITDKVINESFEDLMPALNVVVEKANAEEKNISLLIICGDMQGEPLGTLTINKIQRKFPVVAVKAPDFGDDRTETLEDLAIITGATVISEEKGLKLTDVTEEHFGYADRVIVDKEYTTIIGRRGEVPAMIERVDAIKEQKAKDTQNAQAWRLDKRIAMLTGGIGVIYVGGRSEQEMKESFFRLEDSLSATKAALQDGYVIGGGIAYLNAAQHIGDNEMSNADQRHGYMAVVSALSAPVKRIIENAGDNPEVTLAGIISRPKGTGFDALTNTFEPLIERGIIDPAKVATAAIANAGSIAGMIITTDCVITTKVKD